MAGSGDSVRGDFTTTNSLAVGGSVNGSINALGDHDWFAVTMTAGQSFLFRTNSVAGGVTDTTLTVHNSTGAVVAFNDDIGGGNTLSQLRFTAATAGTYYLDIGAFDDSEIGAFNITAEVAPPLPVFTNDQIANQLTNGYRGGASHHFNVAPGGTLTVNITALTTAGQTLARDALSLWTDASGIIFTEITTTAQITFDDDAAGAFASAVYSGGITTSAKVNVSTAWLANSGTGVNSYSFQTYVHEIGHALGLGHGGNYNGSADYGSDALYQNDSWATTIMSYFDQQENLFFKNQNFTRQFALSPIVADGIAISNLYGVNMLTRTGDTVYGFGNTSDRAIYDATNNPNATYTIFDNGGIDTLNYSGFGSAQTINLNAEAFSNIGGRVGNVTIARGATIENAVGGTAADIIIGNTANNVLTGNSGADSPYGGGRP